MAKRKRLTPAQMTYLESEIPVLETKSANLAPIAQVAGEASASAALDELAGEMRRARESGRLIQDLPQEKIEAGYLVRDRIMADDAELRVLMDSLAARGQQTPIEVVALEQGRFGLISGWRRLTALRRLQEETGDEKFGLVQAILRQPDTAADAYIAMVEENEIRVGLSYYERARVAAKAVEQGVYETEKAALQALFSTASRAKRSKIRSFLPLYHGLDQALSFANAIPERLGLALSKVLQDDPDWAGKLRDGLVLAAPKSPQDEITCLEAMLVELQNGQALISTSETKSEALTTPAPKTRTTAYSPVPGIYLAYGGTPRDQTLTLSGPALNDEFRDKLLSWIKSNR